MASTQISHQHDDYPSAESDPDTLYSELSEPCWSVISFERVEASGLTYSEALATVEDLEARGIPGICIVTEAAASRIRE